MGLISGIRELHGRRRLPFSDTDRPAAATQRGRARAGRGCRKILMSTQQSRGGEGNTTAHRLWTANCTSASQGKASARKLNPSAGKKLKAPERNLSAAKKPRRGRKLCEHQRQHRVCKDCGGNGICEHQRRRTSTSECGSLVKSATAAVSASTSDGEANVKTAAVAASASTGDGGAGAKTVAVAVSASTSACGAGVKTAAATASASTCVSGAGAKTVAVAVSASTGDGGAGVKTGARVKTAEATASASTNDCGANAKTASAGQSGSRQSPTRVSVCVREKERERERLCLCVCVCVCVRAYVAEPTAQVLVESRKNFLISTRIRIKKKKISIYKHVCCRYSQEHETRGPRTPFFCDPVAEVSPPTSERKK